MERPEQGLPLLRAVINQIDDHPETWNQERLACGTTCCVAGHAVVMRGHDLRIDKYGSAYYTADGNCIWDLGALELSLTNEEASDLFHEDNSREDIQRIAEQVAANRGETL